MSKSILPKVKVSDLELIKEGSLITVEVKKHKIKTKWNAIFEPFTMFLKLDRKILKDEAIRIDNEIMQLLKINSKKE